MLIYPILFLFLFAPLPREHCPCQHVISLKENFVDANKMKVQPGDTICLEAGPRRFLQLRNFQGDSLRPLIIMNYKGEVIIENSDFYYGFTLESCKYFRLTGTGDPSKVYGIRIKGTGPGANGLNFSGSCSDFEADHIEVCNTGFAGIVSKTDPDCEGKFTRGAFVQKNISFHDNYIHHTGGEGFYIGNSFYSGWDDNQKCRGTLLLPHEIHGLRIYNNKLEYIGWDGIQAGCATEDVEISGNTIEYYGLSGIKSQGNGIQIGEGTTGKVYNNIIKNGKGNGIILLGLGNNLVYNNLIVNAGENGIFCDDRETIPGSEIAIINNTIITPAENGISIFSEPTINKCYNNIIIAPENYKTFEADDTHRKGQDAFIFLLSREISCEDTCNFFDISFQNILFMHHKHDDFRLKKNSPAVCAGKDVSSFGIHFDLLNNPRPAGKGFDMGALEYTK